MDRGEPADILHPLTSLKWRECRGPPVDVYYADMVCLEDKVYVGGGVSLRDLRTLEGLYIYTLATDTWDTIDTPVWHFALTVYRSQLVLVGGRENISGRPSNKVRTLGEYGQWQTTLPPMRRACPDASAVSHGDHLFVIVTYESIHICDGHNWARAQHPIFSSSVALHITSTVIDGYWYVLSGGEVHYTSLDSLLASCQPSDTPQSSSVWKRLPDAPRGSCCLTKFGTRLVAVGGSAIYALVHTILSWVLVRRDPFMHMFPPCVVALSSTELMFVAGPKAYKVMIQGTPLDPQHDFCCLM